MKTSKKIRAVKLGSKHDNKERRSTEQKRNTNTGRFKLFLYRGINTMHKFLCMHNAVCVHVTYTVVTCMQFVKTCDVCRFVKNTTKCSRKKKNISMQLSPWYQYIYYSSVQIMIVVLNITQTGAVIWPEGGTQHLHRSWCIVIHSKFNYSIWIWPNYWLLNLISFFWLSPYWYF